MPGSKRQKSSNPTQRQDRIAKWFAQGLAHQQAGRLPKAEALYRRILKLEPRHPQTLYMRGHVARQQGRIPDAVTMLSRAVSSQPDNPTFHNDLGMLYMNHPGLALSERCSQAELCYREALRLQPEWPEAWYNLAQVYSTRGDPAQAARCYRDALRLKPDLFQAHNNLGQALMAQGNTAEAERCFAEALGFRPDYVEALYNQGTALQELARYDEALQCFDDALRLQPDYAFAQWNRANLRLLKGDLAGGWEGFEWRFRAGAVEPATAYADKPRWSGDDPSGKTILVWAEQGLGDTIQFVRYLAMIRSRGARVVLACPPPLQRLLTGADGIDQIIPAGQQAVFDFQVPLLSLPGLFSTTLETIPAGHPYVYPPAGLVARWQQRLAADPDFRVGLVWAGNPKHGRDYIRSCGISDLSPVFDVPGVSFYSLQKGPAGEALANSPHQLPITDWSDELDDFADTAALIANLDLVISADTSVAHLAGAMGKPVWTLIYANPDWRWMLDRADTPWYPTMRLFRQQQHSDWGQVLADVAQALKLDRPTRG